MNRKPNKLVGEVVSRITMAIVGAAMLFGGYKCLSVAHRIWGESVDNVRGTGIFVLIGITLVILGGFFVLAALVRVGVLARWIQIRGAGPFDGSEATEAQGLANLFRFFNWW